MAAESEHLDEHFLHDSSFVDDEELEGIHAYSLRRPTRHLLVVWRTYNSILLDIARQCQIPLDHLIGFHHLQAPTNDQHDAEEGVILEYQGDVPTGSDVKLVLIDVVLHFHAFLHLLSVERSISYLIQ